MVPDGGKNVEGEVRDEEDQWSGVVAVGEGGGWVGGGWFGGDCCADHQVRRTGTGMGDTLVVDASCIPAGL